MSKPQLEAVPSTPAHAVRVRPPWPPQHLPVRAVGWSESSWDLARGLTVLEGLPGDASLAEWIGASLLEPAPRPAQRDSFTASPSAMTAIA